MYKHGPARQESGARTQRQRDIIAYRIRLLYVFAPRNGHLYAGPGKAVGLFAHAGTKGICAGNRLQYLLEYRGFAVAFHAFCHHLQEVLTREVREPEDLFSGHAELLTDFRYRLTFG